VTRCVVMTVCVYGCACVCVSVDTYASLVATGTCTDVLCLYMCTYVVCLCVHMWFAYCNYMCQLQLMHLQVSLLYSFVEYVFFFLCYAHTHSHNMYVHICGLRQPCVFVWYMFMRYVHTRSNDMYVYICGLRQH